MGSRGRWPHRAHPLFSGLVEAAVNRQRAERLVEVEVVATEVEDTPAGAVPAAVSATAGA